MTRRIGIYPGTFDPVHPGHIAFATDTLQTCNLEEVVFLPEHSPRGKQGVTSVAHRIELIKAVTSVAPRLQVATLRSKQFTVQETLPELRELFGDASLTLLIGSDVLRSLASWGEVDKLLSEIDLAIGMRSGTQPNEVAAFIQALEKQYALSVAHTPIYTNHADVTSSRIRNGAINPARLPGVTLAYLRKHARRTMEA